MSQNAHKNWLYVTVFVIWSFAPVFFLGTMEATSEPARFTLDLLSWPLNGETTYDSSNARLLSALTAGFLLGWGIMVLLLRNWFYDETPEKVRKTVLISILCWFFLDSLGSITSGSTSNAFFNILVLLISVGPLWCPAKKIA
ncbi:MAG: hypothetical protein AAGJ18_11065 [Bacteroidota bacterium]